MRMKPLDTDSANSDPEISVFLLLCAEHQRLVEGIAVKCREVVPSDPFIPHMTTYFGLGAPVHGRQGLVERIAQVTGPVSHLHQLAKWNCFMHLPLVGKRSITFDLAFNGSVVHEKT